MKPSALLVVWRGLVAGALGSVVVLLIYFTGDAGSSDGGRFAPATLGDKVAAACAPWIVSDWHVDYTDPSLLQVSCYDPKSSGLRTTVVER